MSQTPPDERTVLSDAPPPYRPGDLAWRCGFEHALRQVDATLEKLTADLSRYADIDEAERVIAYRVARHHIRNMKPEAPK